VEFLSAQGLLYRIRRRWFWRLPFLWVCAGNVVAWVEQPRLWLRQYRVQYGGASYSLRPDSPLSQQFRLYDQTDELLLRTDPAGRHRVSILTVYAPLSLELVALVYATMLLFWRHTSLL
jgi:hypothetical protein